jgi:hypothetical protein
MMNFGGAIEALKDGKIVARKGWNGKGMWLVLVTSSPKITTTEGSPYHSAGVLKTTIDAHIDMYTAGGTMQPGWLASQADILAEDWSILI